MELWDNRSFFFWVTILTTVFLLQIRFSIKYCGAITRTPFCYVNFLHVTSRIWPSVTYICGHWYMDIMPSSTHGKWDATQTLCWKPENMTYQSINLALSSSYDFTRNYQTEVLRGEYNGQPQHFCHFACFHMERFSALLVWLTALASCIKPCPKNPNFLILLICAM